MIITARELVTQTIQRQIAQANRVSSNRPQRLPTLMTMYLTFMYDYNFFTINSPSHVQDLWEYIRSDEERVSAIIEATTHLKLMLGDRLAHDNLEVSGVPFEGLIRTLAAGFEMRQDRDETCMDVYTRDQMGSYVEYKALFDNNHWLVIPFIVSTLDLNFTQNNQTINANAIAAAQQQMEGQDEPGE